MRYLALLRGVNVGGANKVKMAELRRAFESAGMVDVRTYINSGNVVFSTDIEDTGRLEDLLTRAVGDATGVNTSLLLRDAEQMAAVVSAIPPGWRNDDSMKCDVVFLRADVDRPATLKQLEPRPGIEDALYVPGAVIWRVDRANATRSRLTRIVGTPLYAHVTVRNCNTTRALYGLMKE